MKKTKRIFPAWAFGIIAAALAVFAQAKFSLHPPQAYGICLVCHARDLINFLLNDIAGYDGLISTVGKRGPMLTTLMLFVGAFLAAIINKEFRLKKQGSVIGSFFCGLIVMVCGLYISACPMRMLLRSAYGDIEAMLFIPFLVAGIFIATFILKRRAKKS